MEVSNIKQEGSAHREVTTGSLICIIPGFFPCVYAPLCA
jgi:hypothetical protein